jgi:hypothetical protein
LKNRLELTIREEAVDWLGWLIGFEVLTRDIDSILKGGINYSEVKIKKKNGKIRKCFSPDDDLKNLQRVILKKILYKIPISRSLYGFVPEVQMKEGCVGHIKKERSWNSREGCATARDSISLWILQLDFRNFFPSIKKDVVQRMLEDILTGIVHERGFTKAEVFLEFCRIVTEITTFQGKLVQGAPTSPYLANLALCWIGVVDELAETCYNNIHPRQSFIFSVYADDITVSSLAGNRPSKKRFVEALQRRGVVSINPEKTRLNNLKHRAHKITGISLHHEIGEYKEIKNVRPTLSTKKQKFYRGRINKAIEFLREGRIPVKNEDGFSLEQVRGYIGWIKHVCGEHIPSSLRKIIPLFEELAKEVGV